MCLPTKQVMNFSSLRNCEIAKLRGRAQHKLDFLFCKALVLDPSKPQQSCTVQSLLVGFSVQHNPCSLLHLRVNPVRQKRERF